MNPETPTLGPNEAILHIWKKQKSQVKNVRMFFLACASFRKFSLLVICLWSSFSCVRYAAVTCGLKIAFTDIDGALRLTLEDYGICQLL